MTETEAHEMVRQHLAELGRQRQEQLEAALSGPVHIRKRIARKRGNTFYRVQYSASENGSQTLCGAPAGHDRTWAETRFPKHLAAVTCDTCKQVRTTA